MCSVVGYIGKQLSKTFIIEGLSRLEYRGYDSAGFACIDTKNPTIACIKTVGPLAQLVSQLQEQPFDGFVAIGHTRWATHGSQSIENAHPHLDCLQKVAVVHNGIIENHAQLRTQLLQQHHFSSQTDSEVVAHLFEHYQTTCPSLLEIVQSVIHNLEGAFALVVVLADFPDTIVLVRKQSPLCVGIGEQEMFIASDSIAFAGKAQQVIFLPESTIAFVQTDGVSLYTFEGKAITVMPQPIRAVWQENGKNEHQHFMLKEIYEQPNVIHNTIDYLESISGSIAHYLGVSADYLHNLEHIKLVGCGASWHASRIAQFFFESIAHLPTGVHLASEFRYMPFFAQQNSIALFVSQSGETADTLEALRLVANHPVPTVAVTNVESSSMVQEASGMLCTKAGPEIAVASTKAFSAQLVALYWLAHRIAIERRQLPSTFMNSVLQDTFVAADILRVTIERYKEQIITSLAPFYAQFKQAICLGRHISYPFALEAALKLKEIAYIFSQCYPAGELKHGPLALIDDKTPLFVFSVLDPLLYKKLLSNVQEAKARKAHIVAFLFEGQTELGQLADTSFYIPVCAPLLAPLAMTGLMQFFVYAVANHLGLPIDRPRNLAKSVTVE